MLSKKRSAIRTSSLRQAAFETLEDRRLLSAFAADIDFEPAKAPVPSGYVADTGLTYGDRGNGLTYGWNGKHKAQVLARHLRKPTDGMDNLYDSYAVMHPKGTGSQWQIAVPDGNYQVSVTAGDPMTLAGRDTIDLNGAPFLDGKVKRAARWISASMQVTVTDGFITLTVPKGRSAKIDFIDISQIVASPQSPTSPTGPTTPAVFNTGVIIPAAQFGNNSGGVATEAGGTTGTLIDESVAGEWVDYTVHVASAGLYTLSASVANDTAGGSFHGEFGGANVTGAMAVPDTGGLTTFSTVTSGSFNLASGSQTLRVFIDQAASTGTAGNFDDFEVNAYTAPPVVTPPPVAPPADTPYSTAFATSQIIPAAEYDDGGAGVSYEVATTSNPGNDNFRSGDAVDINTGGSTGNVVTMPSASEWLNFTVDVATPGSYVLATSVANDGTGGRFHAEVGTSNLTGDIAIPNTGGASTFQTVTSTSFTLAAGTQLLHVVFDQASSTGIVGNFDTFELLPYTPPVQTPVEAPFNATPFTVGQTIPAAQYDLGGQGLGYSTTATSNVGNDSYRAPDPVGMVTGGSTGNVIGHTIAGEWLDYTIAVAVSGNYQLSASVANAAAGGSFHAEVDGVNVTGAMSVPNVGNFTSFQIVTSGSVSLTAGVHILRIVFDTAASNGAVGNFDTFSLATAPATTTGSIAPLSWTSLAQPGVPTIEGGSIGVNGKLYVIGGFYSTGDGEGGELNDGTWRGSSVCQTYDPSTNTWSYIAPLPDPETHEECATDGTSIYVAGGNLYNPVNTYQTFATTKTWRYDIAANTWSAYVPLPAPRGAGSMVLVGNNLHFMGGVDVNRVPQNTHWKLDITSANPQWVLDTAAPSPRNHVATFSYGGKIYLMGGRDLGTDTGLPVNTCYVFDPNTDAWSQIASMPKPLAVTCYAVVDGLLVIMGGSNDASTPIDTVIAYNPATNTWNYLNSFPSAKIGPNGGLVGNELIVSGGADIAGGPDGLTYGAQVVAT